MEQRHHKWASLILCIERAVRFGQRHQSASPVSVTLTSLQPAIFAIPAFDKPMFGFELHVPAATMLIEDMIQLVRDNLEAFTQALAVFGARATCSVRQFKVRVQQPGQVFADQTTRFSRGRRVWIELTQVGRQLSQSHDDRIDGRTRGTGKIVVSFS